jgi:hypothetical protein
MAVAQNTDAQVRGSMNGSAAGAVHPFLAGVAAAVLADPIADLLAEVLTVPLRELYALLWRAGVMQIAAGPANVARKEVRAR